MRALLVATLGIAAIASSAAAEDCKPAGAASVSGTLTAPAKPCVAAKKPEPAKQKDKDDGFWSGVYVGGSVGTSTAIRGR
jgi:hypothetical protein